MRHVLLVLSPFYSKQVKGKPVIKLHMAQLA